MAASKAQHATDWMIARARGSAASINCLVFTAINPGTTLSKIHREHHDCFSIPLDIDKARAIEWTGFDRDHGVLGDRYGDTLGFCRRHDS
jgi:hypothetical protein